MTLGLGSQRRIVAIFWGLKRTVVIGGLFMLAWLEIDSTGLDWFYCVYKGHLFYQQDTYDCIAVAIGRE